MPENDEFWDFYWETRLPFMENMGKRAAVLAASRLIRRMGEKTERPLRLLELGCGDGQIIGHLLEAHSGVCSIPTSAGVDYSPEVLKGCIQRVRGLKCIQGDFSDPALLARLGKFDLVLLVNALHEVFSDCYSSELGEIDVPAGKEKVKQTLAGAAGCMAPDGWLVVFDGLEPEGALVETRCVRFRDVIARSSFETFANEYQPLRIKYREVDGPLCIELSLRDFTRYLTKSNFLGKPLWATERLQSYQYFTEKEFRFTYDRLGLMISELNILTLNEDKWDGLVSLEPPETRFPDEHILILGQQKDNHF